MIVKYLEEKHDLPLSSCFLCVEVHLHCILILSIRDLSHSISHLITYLQKIRNFGCNCRLIHGPMTHWKMFFSSFQVSNGQSHWKQYVRFSWFGRRHFRFLMKLFFISFFFTFHLCLHVSKLNLIGQGDSNFEKY